MKRFVLLLVLVAVLVATALPVEAFGHRWYYYHPSWGWGWWAFAPPPLYPQVHYSSPPQVVIQQVPIQTPQYIQRQPEPQQQQAVWYWCRTEPQGFHPYVTKCKDDAWLKVLPSTEPPSTAPQR